jgi:predicted ester cyclase
MKSSLYRPAFWMVILLLPGLSYAQDRNNTQKYTAMEKNKSAIYELYEQCLNGRNMSLLRDLITDDFSGPGGLHGVAAFQASLEPLINAFPDIHYELTSVMAADDKVAVSWQWTGTSTNTYLHFQPTGKKITNEGIAIFTFRDGRIAASTVQTDRLGFLQGLGVLPQDVAGANAAQVFFIDKFFVPAPGIGEFTDRMNKNRTLLKTMPGFIKDDAYSYNDGDGNLICVTIAVWKDHDAVDNAKKAVQAEYKKEGFDMAAMLQRLHITIDRGVYSPMQAPAPLRAPGGK